MKACPFLIYIPSHNVPKLYVCLSAPILYADVEADSSDVISDNSDVVADNSDAVDLP